MGENWLMVYVNLPQLPAFAGQYVHQENKVAVYSIEQRKAAFKKAS